MEKAAKMRKNWKYLFILYYLKMTAGEHYPYNSITFVVTMQ